MARKYRILVVGDAMLDTYIYGKVSRVSPEAPIPVICPSEKEYCPGGAANVACNAAALGASVTAVFLLGADSQAEQLKNKLRDFHIALTCVSLGAGQHTVNKIRLIGNGQQIARIDVHDCYTPDISVERKLLAQFQNAVSGQDVIVLSDYGKGTCTENLCREIIRLSEGAGKPVIVDPKGTDWEKYRGAFFVTPNMNELNLFCGNSVPNEENAIETAYGGLCRELGFRHLLLTRSERGMSLLDNDTVLHFPTQAREVNDVSGAGDTVVAALSVSLARDPADVVGAVRFANAAAGVVVGKSGTSFVTMEEVLAWMAGKREAEGPRMYTAKDMDALKRTVDRWRAAGETIVTANGCFDVLHMGHLKLLKEAKRMGSRLIVVVNADASVKRLKGPLRPVNREQDRAAMLLSLRMVDAVAIFDPMEDRDELLDCEKARLSAMGLAAAPEAPMALMRRIRPDVHVKGGDYTPEDVPEAIFAKRLALVPFVKGYSTTGTLEKMERRT